MKYEQPKPISKDAALQSLKGTCEVASEALIRAAMTIQDRNVAELILLRGLSDSRAEVRRAALIGFGHVARIHRKLSLSGILPEIQKLANDPELQGTVEDVLEDIAMFAHGPLLDVQ